MNVISGEGSKSKFRGKRTMLGGGAKKKYKNAWTIGDSRAFELKGLVDKELTRLVGRARMGKLGGEEKRGGGTGNVRTQPPIGVGGQIQATGMNPTRTPQLAVREVGKSKRRQVYCTDCGKLARSDYVRCPFH